MDGSLPDIIKELTDKVRVLEGHFADSGYNFKKIVTSEIKRAYRLVPQEETQFGLFTGLVVDTIDPLKQGRVRFFSPLFHDPNSQIESLDFAFPISSMGGFDDCGLMWVPPVGSTLCVVFEHGNRSSPYYLGTTWHRDRGADGSHKWGYNIQEYYKIHEGHRKGYMVGADDGSQVLPSWNTESYNGIDVTSKEDFDATPEAQKKITYPNIYGFKTPQKHMLKMVDGDYKCNHKNKRVEMLSGCGNWLMFKDDHLHEFSPSGDDQECEDSVSCEGEEGPDLNNPSNSPYFKHKNELRPWKGPGTPQNNKAQLKQSGIQMLSISGHTWGMDDSVSEPAGVPEWERSMRPFDFGCENKYRGFMFFTSATGHKIEMIDKESDTEVREDRNGIRLKTACGQLLEMNDHSKDKTISGDRRGIIMQSTSNHTFELHDGEDLEQGSPRREGDSGPIPKAKNAYVALRSGYGLSIIMADDHSQEKTEQQSIEIFSPQRDNKERGPHIMRFQEAPSGPGQVFLRVGGNYICVTYDNHYTIVGDEEKNPADKATIVSKNTLVMTKEYYLNQAKVHWFNAKEIIILGAGQDCPIPNSTEKGPCINPVLCLNQKGQIVMSDRVFVSASPDAACATIFQLRPFHQC